jgi:hypothetical protein
LIAGGTGRQAPLIFYFQTISRLQGCGIFAREHCSVCFVIDRTFIVIVILLEPDFGRCFRMIVRSSHAIELITTRRTTSFPDFHIFNHRGARSRSPRLTLSSLGSFSRK